ncbi:glycerophosphodiester phosphodiesterase family protein [Georgenia muralis]|uniref:Glycerophosphoryl diester phosphodiesterase n=1 Tax=Georgenia muralis TaxID=154117 RepID=A0A3N5A9W1_9MICO|nr:glycerophosphodiester phosphodiesterase family protein [Georgenia muralis]RPF28431.1 glycerophosphoryl diester phosphodiesterase [Georgenia muralis]
MSTQQTPALPWRPGTTQVLGHRGARGLAPENTLVGFLHAHRVGATAMELDVQLSADGEVVVWHDPVLTADKAVDTAPATREDPLFPYVGSRLRELTYGQLASVDVGRRTAAAFPEQRPRPGARIPLLGEVLQALAEVDPEVWTLVEMKTDPTDPGAEPEALVRAVVEVVRACGAGSRVVLQSFDWHAVDLAGRAAPDLPRAALAVPGLTFARGSAWLGPVHYDDHDGDLAAAAHALGVQAVAPAYASPYGARAGDDGFALVTDRAFVDHAHEVGLAVLPWTVNGDDDLAHVLAAGVDGVISDRPDRAAALVAAGRPG